MNDITTAKGEIVMYQPDETIRLEVRVEDETVWLSQAQMADLFGTKRQAITKHLLNIYECEELKKQATCSILELVRKEGNRMVKKETATIFTRQLNRQQQLDLQRHNQQYEVG